MTISERPALIVSQPAKIASLLETLNLIDQVSERIGEDKSGDLGGGAGTGPQGGTRKTTISPREQAILNLPSPEAMQAKLKQKIQMEVKLLHRKIRSISRVSKPGNAFKLNLLYARIRRLNGLLAELIEASFEILKRLFVRVFIDEQPVF